MPSCFTILGLAGAFQVAKNTSSCCYLEFPERPGALRKFLVGLHKGWNISLFHYRNHGAGTYLFSVCPHARPFPVHKPTRGRIGGGPSFPKLSVADSSSSLPSCNSIAITDLGKVLAGIQVPPTESAEFDGFLKTLGYPYVEETENEVYKRYLKGNY